jgi:hypothetical protein
MRRRAASLVALAALWLSPAGAAGHGARERPLSCAVVAIDSDQTPRAFYRFRATRIVDLRLEVRLLHHPKRDHSLQLRLYTPDGFLYQVLDTRAVRGRAGFSRYEARLPVAGSSIMTSGLYGRWRVVPHADGAREPCGTGRGFVIHP